MKASFIKRVLAFLIDSFILSIVFSVITINFNTNSDEISNKFMEKIEQYQNNEITIEEYTDSVVDLNYQLQKSSVRTNALQVVLYVGYFIVFGYLNKGQTVGKKLFKIKVVNKDGSLPSIWNVIVRSLLIYGIFTLLYSIVFVNIFDKYIFTYGYMLIDYTIAIFVMIAFFMALYRKDGRGLHDVIARTYVIEEVK